MEDLNDKIARVLSDPDSLAKIQGMMAALGGGDSPAPPAATIQETTPPPGNGGGASMPDLGALSRLMPLMGAFDREDDDTRLLQALRPYLHGERAGRLDETMKLLKLTRLLPLLQEQGILGGKEHG